MKPNYLARRILALLIVGGIIALFWQAVAEWNVRPVCDWVYLHAIGSMGCKP